MRRDSRYAAIVEANIERERYSLAAVRFQPACNGFRFLDRETADQILKTLQLANTQFNKTILMVTHDPEAAKFAKRTLHLDKGHFIEKDLEAGRLVRIRPDLTLQTDAFRLVWRRGHPLADELRALAETMRQRPLQ